MDKNILTLYVLTIIPDYPEPIVWGEYKAVRADSLGWSILGVKNDPYGYFADREMYTVEPHTSIYENGRYVIRGFDKIKIQKAWNNYVDGVSNKVVVLNNFKFPL